jgi:hypothetical protein
MRYTQILAEKVLACQVSGNSYVSVRLRLSARTIVVITTRVNCDSIHWTARTSGVFNSAFAG